MKTRTVLAVALFSLTLRSAFAVRYAVTPAQKEVVSSWLAKHPGYRLATDQDCACNEDLQTIRSKGYGGRWKPIPDYHPYIVVGDFNGDGEDDIAVAVVRANGAHGFAILVFNGPLKPDESPSLIEMDGHISGVGFFYGPPRPKPYRLVVGEFESEGYVLTPKGKTYSLEPNSSENE